MKKISACRYCGNSGLETMDAVGACNCCEGFCRQGFNGFYPEDNAPWILKELHKAQTYTFYRFAHFDSAIKQTAASKVLCALFACAYLSTIFISQLFVKPLPADS